MRIFAWLFGGKKRKLNKKFKQLKDQIQEQGRIQGITHKVRPEEAARQIGLFFGLNKKKPNPADFINIAVFLLTFPAELAFLTILKLNNNEHPLKFDPSKYIMTALAKMKSLASQILFDQGLLKKNKRLADLIRSQQLMVEKAAKLLAVAILASSESLAVAQQKYRKNNFDPLIKRALDKELQKYDWELSRQIMNKKRIK